MRNDWEEVVREMGEKVGVGPMIESGRRVILNSKGVHSSCTVSALVFRNGKRSKN